MSTETELQFLQWLQRPEKTFTENFQFALKAWKSAEFMLSSKYQIVLQWFCQQINADQLGRCVKALPLPELKELLQLKCPPGLVAQQVKLDYVRAWLQWATPDWQSPVTRVPSELLQQLVEYEIVQDIYRSNYELYAQLMGQLLQCYERYLQQMPATTVSLPSHESAFFARILSNLHTSAKNAGDTQSFEAQYTLHVLQPLVEVSLALQRHSEVLQCCCSFFDELLALEQQMCREYSAEQMMQRLQPLPIHVFLTALEYAIVSQRGVEHFQQLILKFIFEELLDQQGQQRDAALVLATTAYVLEMFHKHDIKLSFEMEPSLTALTYLSTKINNYVTQFREQHLSEVLQLLCSTLRLNPLIVEKSICQHTIWMIVAPKRTQRDQRLFEQFLVLLMQMFRKLSRAEKFVANLLKALQEWRVKHNVDIDNCPTLQFPPKLSESAEEPPSKRRKLASTSDNNSNSKHLTQYLEVIFKNFSATISEFTDCEKSPSKLVPFPRLQQAWPWQSAGVAFSKLITGLMSKPALVVAKQLLFGLKEVLHLLCVKRDITEKDAFQLDFIAALLCQYFAGCGLAEQSNKFRSELNEQRQLTAEVLQQFGRLLLSLPHNKRAMNAFLECCFYAAHFKLLVWYYRSDEFRSKEAERDICESSGHIHRQFLGDDEEWTLLQQRVINFGKSSCKFNMNRLLLQRAQARILFQRSQQPIELSLEKILLTPLSSGDLEQLKLLLCDTTHVRWLLRNLQRVEKLEIARLLSNSSDGNSNSNSAAVELNDACLIACSSDLELLELLCLSLLERMSHSFAAAIKKSSVLGAIKFDELLVAVAMDEAQDKRAIIVAQQVQAMQLAPSVAIKKLPLVDVQHMLHAFGKLPIGSCRRQTKGVLFGLLLALYRDLCVATQQQKPNELAMLAFDEIMRLLHFGAHLQVSKLFDAQKIVQLLPVAHCWQFYEWLFATIGNSGAGAGERFLNELLQMLNVSEGELSAEHLQLVLISIETLSSLSGPSAKHLRKYLTGMLAIYAQYIGDFFACDTDRDEQNGKEFVERTLPGFAAYVKSRLGKAGTELDEDFRRICKIYIGYSMNYNNKDAIKLISLALSNCQALHFDPDEIEFVLSGYWRQLYADLKTSRIETQHAEHVIKLIVANKTNEDFLLLLRQMAADWKEQALSNVTQLLTLLAKCAFSSIKGAIFHEQFKQMSLDIIMLRLQKSPQLQYVDTQQLLQLLACQQTVVENRTLLISADTLDDILTFLMDINIKTFPINDTNVPSFCALHLAMSELCTALLKQRHLLLLDRVPQFMHIFKDLLQSLVCYKSERQKDTALGAAEIDELVKLALKLEALMHIIATHGLEMKRVAPFVLTFVINLMVVNKRPTTLYPKIKTHIENVCYDLIGICDHRVGRFILRCSNEAARQVYELLLKEHKKYHKFKGKV